MILYDINCKLFNNNYEIVIVITKNYHSFKNIYI